MIVLTFHLYKCIVLLLLLFLLVLLVVLLLVQCNGAFCPFLENTAKKVDTMYSNTNLHLLFNTCCF